MIYSLRLVVPDRPGSLGAVATAIGVAGGDIVALDVIERGPDGAVDDLLVDLPAGLLADTLVSAAHVVPGVVVDSIRPYLGGHDVLRDLELVDRLAAAPADALEVLTELSPYVFRSGWALLVEAAGAGAAVRHASEFAPDTVRLGLPWLPLPVARRLDGDEPWVPASWSALGTELMAAPVGRTDLALLLGRSGGPTYRPSEVLRLAHLASITGTVLAPLAGRLPGVA